MPTSGMGSPAFSDCSRTVCTSHCSVLLDGVLMSSMEYARMAIHLEISSEKRLPVKPMTSDITMRPV